MKNYKTVSKWQATLTDWCIVFYPEIYNNIESPVTVYAKFNCGRSVALFGRAKNDPRYNAETGSFTDSHRLVTSPITAVIDGKYYTEDTIYTLDEKEKNSEFQKWCKENQYVEVPFTDTCVNEEQGDMVLRHICENCGKEQILSSEEGYKQGWDYPPKMGTYKIISPRTCGECCISTTLWWEIACNKIPIDQLIERHQQTLKRILNEPESIMP
jgi:hypothetical protein